MIAHISIGVKDVGRSKRFYDAVLEPLGYRCIKPAKALVGYGYGRDTVALWVVAAERPVAFDPKSVCISVSMRRAGGHDNGSPGLRPQYSPDYYAAFVIDPDGYRIEAYYGPGEA